MDKLFEGIFDWAEEYSYASDYMDIRTGYIYHVQEYGRAIKLGLPTAGIRVTDFDGNFVCDVEKVV